jgi:hypothetical protein
LLALLASTINVFVQKWQVETRKSKVESNMRQIANAMRAHIETNKRYPARIGPGKGQKLSWRVAILPFVNEQSLYDQFHLDEPWDSDNNKKLIKKMPEVFYSPQRPKDGKTLFLVPVGKDTVFENPNGISDRGVSNSQTRTIILVEANEDRTVIWTKPDDLEYDAARPMNGLGHAWPDGFHAAFADGTPRFIKVSVNLDILKSLFSRWTEYEEPPRVED